MTSAKRKRTSQPRARPAPPAKAPRRPARTARAVGDAATGAARAVRRSAFLIGALGLIGLGVYTGVHSAHKSRERDFGTRQASSRTTPDDQPSPAGPAPNPRRQPARALFADQCGACHTLGAAGSDGRIGPDLDRIEGLSARRVRAQIANGSPDGAMPSDILVGRDADRVARYVARVAAHGRD